MRWWILPLLVGLLITACSPSAEVALTTTTTDPTPTTVADPPSNEICLAGDVPFAEEGLIAALGDDAGDAAAVTSIRLDASANCERLTVSFEAESGAPATTLGPTGVSVIAYAGLLRIVLPPDVAGTAVADSLLEGDLVHAAYVVRTGDHLTIDVHAPDGIPIAARAFTTTSPASLIVDIAQAATDAIPVGVTTSDVAVVVDPTPGASQYPIVVDGYAAPGLQSVQVALVRDGEPLQTVPIDLAGDTDNWQVVEATIEQGPVGTNVLFVGTVADDGQPESGALVSITTE